MNSLPLSTFGRLAIGVSRTSIRTGSTFKRYKKPQPELTYWEPGHGERIWVFNHIMSDQIIYSHKPAMDSNRAMRQLPFNGKKSKPAKLRRDFWRPMAMIQFSEGQGAVGRSVFQKLREFKREHELSWGWQAKELLSKPKPERSRALNAQKANSVADMAAVLGGAGRGNRILVTDAATKAVETEGQPRELVPATIYWANEFDVQLAQEWPTNVSHQVGLPPTTSRRKQEEDVGVLAEDESASQQEASATAQA